MGGTKTLRRMAGLLVLAAFAAACSGTPVEDGQAEVGFDNNAMPGDGAGTGEQAVDGATTTDPSQPTDGTAPVADPNAPQGGTSPGGPAAPGGGGGGAPAPGGQTGTSGRPAPASVHEARLYSGADNTRGITADGITLCGHAALVFAEAFDVRPADLNVYWDQVNEAGGVHGRKIAMSWEDDAYSPDRAVQGAEACRAKNPAMLLGGIGFDQIPSVREWAEANKMLYLHHIAVQPKKNYAFSFSAQPTVNDSGRAFGELIASRYGKKKVGVLWRQSENWEPGHRSGLETMKARGVPVVADLPVTNNQGVYSQQILELSRSGAEVVWIWENALAAAQIIQQAASQRYRPKWVVFPFQTTLDVIGENAYNPTIDGVATWPAYSPGGYGGAFAQFGYDEEIKRFEAAYRKYRPNTKLNDILWQTWLGNKFLHEVFNRCGRDCTRNRLAGVFEAGLNVAVNPGCAVNFARPNSAGNRLGGYQFTVLETFKAAAGPSWKTSVWCSEHLG